MKFMLIVKADANTEAGVLPNADLLTAMGAYNEELAKAGVLLGAEGLQRSALGARVHFDGHARRVVDGPFVETKELIAGFWLIQARSLEEAVEWVKRVPNQNGGPSQIEIRRVFEPSDFGQTLSAELLAAETSLREQVVGRAG